MASLQNLPFVSSLFVITLLSLFFTPSYSALTCASQKLNRTYANCTDLPSLGATLHFNFTATNRTLSVAFSAVPLSASGWVAWGLNLAGGNMSGAQALVALPSPAAVQRYNLTSYKSIDQVKAFTFDSWDLSSVTADGAVTIFASVKIPETANNVNQVWQVGPTAGGKPAVHPFKAENLAAKQALSVAIAGTAATTPTSGENATAPASGDGKKNGAAAEKRLGLCFWLLFALMFGAVAL